MLQGELGSQQIANMAEHWNSRNNPEMFESFLLSEIDEDRTLADLPQ